MEGILRREGSSLSALAYTLWLTVEIVIATTLLALFSQERQLLEDGVSQWGRQMPILAVLRDEIDDAAARRLADQLTSEVVGIECTMIDRRQATSLLALQEPWMRQLPDMLVCDLPTLREIRKPALFHSSQQLDEFLAMLQSQREVDFVIFNAVGHERVVDALILTRRHADTLLICGSSGILLLFFGYHYHLIRRRGRWGMARLAAVDGLAWAVGVLLAAGLLTVVSWIGLREPANVRIFFLCLAALASGMVVLLLELIHIAGRRS